MKPLASLLAPSVQEPAAGLADRSFKFRPLLPPMDCGLRSPHQIRIDNFNECHIAPAEYNQFCHPVQRYAATPCNGMLPPSVQSIIHAEGVRGRGVSSIRTMSGSSSGE